MSAIQQRYTIGRDRGLVVTDEANQRMLRGGGPPCLPSRWIPRHEGWIAFPRLLYRGLCRILRNVEASIRQHGGCTTTSNLADLLKMFDKNAVTKLLLQHEIPTPNAFAPTSPGHFFKELSRLDWQNPYVKLAYGSNASGIAKIELTESELKGFTTVAQIGYRFYNTYKVRWLPEHEITPVLKFLIEEHATVQSAVEKTKLDGDDFDVRVVMSGGEVLATVFRASRHPITNLHLGGYRADADRCRKLIPKRSWADAMEICRQAASLFETATAGIDLAFDRRTFEPTILEINAFGDFFPRLTDDHGRSVHELEIASTMKRFGL